MKILLLLVGVILSLPLVPGPGIVILLIGLMLTSFPGKRKLERKAFSRPWVLGPINRFRKIFGKPPIAALGQA